MCLFSQYEKLTIEDATGGIRVHLTDVIPVVNEANKDISLFLIAGNNVYGHLLDENFKIKSKLNTLDKRRKYKKIIGARVINNETYALYFSNKKENKFAVIRYSYSSQDSNFFEINIHLKHEKLLQAIEYNNNFYLITVTPYTSILNIYGFSNNDNQSFEKKQIDLTSIDFINHKNDTTTLFSLLMNSRGVFSANNGIQIIKIETDNPNSIEITSEFNKLYLSDEGVIITLDQNKDKTQLIAINLNSFTAKVSQIKKALIDVDYKKKKSNSYLLNNTFYSLACTSDMFLFEARDVITDTLIKKYSALKTESITFKNTPVIQTGGAFDGYREMESNQKFLRKINSGDIGISAYVVNKKIEISLGGKKEISQPIMMPAMGLVSFGTVSIFFNPSFFAYNSYSHTKATHIKCYFDEGLNHIEGEIPKNPFEKIYDYESENATHNAGQTIFKYGDYSILGYHDSFDKKYQLVKFKN